MSMRDEELVSQVPAAPADDRPAWPPSPDSPAGPPPSRGLPARLVRLLAIGLPLLLIGWLALTAPLSKSLQPIAAPSITLVSADGQEIARRGALVAKPVTLSELPPHVPRAFLAIEDRRFYTHIGIDPWGIARAMWHNAVSGGVRQGGSTISQQLAKLSFLSSERTATRKIQEALIALWLEAWLSKEEILERYLSNVYFGDNVYGLRAAARHYFSRDPEDLTVSQAAMLAGLLKAPSRLAPTSNLEGARQRARLVVNAMVETGALDPEEARRLRPARLDVERVRDLPTGTYFADWILPQARSRIEDPYGPRRVRTTLDSDLQRSAERAVRRARLGGAQVALVAMRPDGTVVAMVGGKDYSQSPFNRATQARRQPGSTFKLFVYLAALRAGMTPDSMVNDTPLTIGDWSPQNNGGRYRGRITLRDAFAVSSNVAAVRLSQQVGIDNVVRAARDLGISSPLSPQPSLALGTSGVSLLELTSAYAGVAGNRFPVQPHGLPEPEHSWWERLWSQRERLGWGRSSSFDERTTWPMLLDLLSAAVERGTGRAAALETPTFGKTGTSQDSRDALFIGFAGDLVTGVWIGNDDNQPLPGAAGGGVPARIWRDFMTAALNIGPRSPARDQQERRPLLVNEEDVVEIPLGPFFPEEDPIGPDEIDIRIIRPPEGPDDEAEAILIPPMAAPPRPEEDRESFPDVMAPQ